MNEDKEQPMEEKSTEVQNFEDALRAILAAPKTEVQAQLAAEKEQRKKRRLAKQQN